MTYYCRIHGAYHAQYINNEQRDLRYLNGIQRNGSLLNVNRNNYQNQQSHLQQSPTVLQHSPTVLQHSPTYLQQTQQNFYNNKSKENFVYKSFNNVNTFQNLYQNLNMFKVPQQIQPTNEVFPTPQDIYKNHDPYNLPQRSQTRNAIHQEALLKSYRKLNKLTDSSKRLHRTQKLFIARHGERVDTTFGHLWLQNAFINGEYDRFNLNMPKTLPKRENINEYIFDPPLTEIGMYQAKLHGEELARKGVKISFMYSSPALRSIQTADKILEGMGLKDTVPIRIETGLFELLSWQSFLPKKYPFMTAQSLIKAGYNIDTTYTPIVPFHTLNIIEDESQFYKRSHYMTQNIVDKHSDGKNI